MVWMGYGYVKAHQEGTVGGQNSHRPWGTDDFLFTGVTAKKRVGTRTSFSILISLAGGIGRGH